MDNALTLWPAPAKLNLFLHILGRNSDGYHQLQSIFQLLDYGDTLSFDTQGQTSISMASPLPGVSDENNLILRAAKLLKATTGTSHGAKITLNKNLPMGGGIGGGSSDAATTLLALNHYWQTGLTVTQLAELGLSLGADVPVFVHGDTAFANGVGEQLTPMPQPEYYYLVLCPPCHVSTAEVFSLADLPRNTPPIEAAEYQFDITRNDCQSSVFELYPEVAKAFEWLLEYAPSRMTGTGASLFARFETRQQAQRCFDARPTHLGGFIAKGVNQSPTKTLLAALQGKNR